MTYVLLTRPEEDCQELQTKLLIPSICSPLLKVSQSVSKVTLPNGTTDLIVTSARVFDMVKNIKDMTKTPVWCVGEATAQAAKEAGFETIFQVNRSAQEILERIVKECQKESSHFVHICGSVVHVDLVDALTKLGYKADRVIIYTTEAADKLSPEAEAIMSAGLVQQMPFFSLRTAEVFVDIARTSDWAENLSKITALAHSDAIARALNQLSWRRVVVVPDLCAERIQEHYIRSGDSKMKNKNPLTSIIMTIILATAVSAAVHMLWPAPKAEPHPFDLTPVDDKIKNLKSLLITQEKALSSQIQALEEQIQLIEEKSDVKIEPPAEDLVEKTPPIPQISENTADHSDTVKHLADQIQQGVVMSDTLEKANLNLKPENRISKSVLSVRDLKDKLVNLPDLTDEISLDASQSIGEKAKDLLGLNIRKSKPSPLKDQAMKDLTQGSFNFITALEQKTLPPEWSRWLQSCKETQSAINSLQTESPEKGE